MLNTNFRWDQRHETLQEHLKNVVTAAIEAFYTKSIDPMDAIQSDADDITYSVAADGRTCLGGQVIYHLAHNVELIIDTFRGLITAQRSGISYEIEFSEDPVGFQMAVSDLFWAVRS